MTSLKFLIVGVLFGLTAGISPGPLLSLVVAETLKHNKAAGIKIAVSPLITDLPIILITILVLSKFSQHSLPLSLIYFSGGIFLTFLGLETIRSQGLGIDLQKSKPASFRKGILANLLNPHPYLFWLTVGTPVVIEAYRNNLKSAVLFLAFFYSSLIGSKIGIVWLVNRSRDFLNNNAYIWIMRLLGISLFAFALYFFYDGLRMLM